MYSRLDRAHRALPVILGVVTLADVGVLLVWDAFPQMVSGAEPRLSRGVFAGDDCCRLSGLPGGSPASGQGTYQGGSAGGCFSVLGGQPVLAGFAAGHAVQRHCDRAVCLRCFPGDDRLAADLAGRLVCRNLRGGQASRTGCDSFLVKWVSRLRLAEPLIWRGIFEGRIPVFWYASSQRNGELFPAIILITTSLVINGLRSPFCTRFF